MKRAAALFVLIAVSALSSFAAAAETAAPASASDARAAASLPPEVTADQWLALSPTAGVQLSAPPARPDAPLVGTLWIQSGGVWRRVYLESPRRAPSAVPASRLHGARGPMVH